MRAFLAALALALLVAPWAAGGHDPAGPQYDAWYASLQHPRLGSCCDRTDCLPTAYRVGPEGYEALIDARFPGVAAPFWAAVPDGNVLARENPTGSAVACWYAGEVRCFVPLPEG
jgi:hypothetical protein